MFGLFGLGKQRSKFGKWVDKKGLTQQEIAEESKVGRTTVSNMCSDPEYSPRIETWVKIQKALKNMGYNVNRDDFFDI
ncbi:DNA-binding XRE family transcriptional regulator [Neobacillus niacini]|uniref:helix-turn-helix transcriptional regulator n=1 Tax=Neobacillus driksii TaxID=3035913 RepID=UPI002785F51A|nr:helix-turn-helix transcriptional regulator [Neobacillus niacini]MDQ0975896.1 DNA-binding XRE family transcriptional regulator [Neobacillus niacini]